MSFKIPNSDVCRLSYYLHSVTVGCALSVLSYDLVDFQKAHKLPQARQDEIVRLAFTEFHPSNLINKIIFFDGNGQYCGNSNNKWFDAVDVHVHVPHSITLQSRLAFIRRVMFFKRVWLRTEFKRPLMNQGRRLVRIMKLERSPRERIRESFKRLLDCKAQSRPVESQSWREQTPNRSNESRTNAEANASDSPDPRVNTPPSPAAQSSSNTFSVGDTIMIVGHSQAGMNGRKGFVEANARVPGGRVRVRLDDLGIYVMIQPNNLKLLGRS